MEKFILGMLTALVQTIPDFIEAVRRSSALSEAEKKQLLFDLNAQLTVAATRVAAVRFKESSFDYPTDP